MLVIYSCLLDSSSLAAYFSYSLIFCLVLRLQTKLAGYTRRFLNTLKRLRSYRGWEPRESAPREVNAKADGDAYVLWRAISAPEPTGDDNFPARARSACRPRGETLASSAAAFQPHPRIRRCGSISPRWSADGKWIVKHPGVGSMSEITPPVRSTAQLHQQILLTAFSYSYKRIYHFIYHFQLFGLV